MNLNETLSVAEKINVLIDNKLYESRTAIPAIIFDINYVTQRVSCKLAIKPIYNDGIETTELESPVVHDVPYYTYNGGDFYVTVPPKKGDECFLIFADRNCDDFWKSGQITSPSYAKGRKHDINDAVALVGFRSFAKKIENYNPNAIEIRNKAKNVNITLSNDSLNLKCKSSSIVIDDSKIAIAKGENKIIITDTGITIDTSVNVNINAKEISLKGSDAISLEAPNVSFKAPNALNIISNKTQVTGAVDINGDLGIRTIQNAPYPPPHSTQNGINGTNEFEKTKGTLTTYFLDDFSVFLEKIPEDGIDFKIDIYDEKLEIKISKERVIELADYDNLASEIQTFLNSKATCVAIASVATRQYSLYYETVEAGTAEGYITYMKDIISEKGQTHGKLQLTNLQTTDFDAFKATLRSKGLAFKVLSGNEYVKFEITFEQINALTTFEEFALLMSEISGKIKVFIDNEILTLETEGAGLLDGQISYLQTTDTSATHATLISGELDTFSTFLNGIGNKNFGVKTTINGTENIYFIKNEDLIKISDWNTFASEVMNASKTHVGYDEFTKKMTIRTDSVGHDSTITYMSAVSEIPATSSHLITNILPSFDRVKDSYSQGSNNITFYLELSDVRKNFTITPDNLKNSYTWSDIANIIKKSDVNVVYTNNCFTFSATVTGAKNFTYLKYEYAENTINGAELLRGAEGVAQELKIGSDKITNIATNSKDLIKMTQEKGAIATNGQDDNFNSDSILLLYGTEEVGAIAVQGKDGVVTVLNNSATLLKGTEATGASLATGQDKSEVPVDYDGILTFVGKLHVTDEIVGRFGKFTDSLEANGRIKFSPSQESETGEVEKTSVYVDGSVDVSESVNIAKNLKVDDTATISTTKTDNLSVYEKAEINELTVNNGIHVTGDIVIDSGAIESKGCRITFESNGIHTSRDMHTPDTWVNE